MTLSAEDRGGQVEFGTQKQKGPQLIGSVSGSEEEHDLQSRSPQLGGFANKPVGLKM